jgi:Tfp pilus assembly protein PilN
MKAGNLIPVEERRGGASGSGIASYILVGVLALVVIMSAAFTLMNRTISDRQDKLAAVQAQAQAQANEAQALSTYTNFAALHQKRSETIRDLATSRFDWSHALREVARTIPSDAWLTSMRGTVSPTSAVEGGSNDPLRGSLPNPAIELIGCTTTQDRVAAVISSLRRIDGIERVSLSSSAKNEKTASKGADDGAASSQDGDCRQGSERYPQFSMTLFFKATPGATAAAQPTTTPGGTR